MKQTLFAEKLELKLKNHSEKAARDQKNIVRLAKIFDTLMALIEYSMKITLSLCF